MNRSIPLAIGLLGMFLTAHAAASYPPYFLVEGSLDKDTYSAQPDDNGEVDDLLSAGLNAEGLQSATPPEFADPLNPTAAELRRLAIYNNFRGITDMTTEGGFGIFWGPALAPEFDNVEQGLIPGVEYKALMKVPAWSRNVNSVPVAVQIPDNFDPADPCLVLATPSGSRGFYGGIAIGEWGLFEGCAVVLPGKATGTGFHVLEPDLVYDRDGRLVSAEETGKNAQFAAKKGQELDHFVASHPDRVAIKHAHSQINPERLWGDLALNGIRFAFWALNDHFAGSAPETAESRSGWPRFRAHNTLVIASGTSNGAGSSLRALEKDHHGLIDGLVVIEPSINPDSAGKFAIRYGDRTFTGHGTSLYDNHTLMGIYAPCAALSTRLAGTPFYAVDPIGAPGGSLENRCKALEQAGLLSAGSTNEQANEALRILRKAGYYEEQDTLLASHEWLNLWRSLNPTYAAAHGRFAVWDKICDITFGATTAEGLPTALPMQSAAMLFATSNGIPATGGVNLIDEAAENGPIVENLAISPLNGLQDLNLDGARCFRYLATGDPDLLPVQPSPWERIQYYRVQLGIAETLTSGDLHGTPSIIIAGRSDALVFPNYHSRPYYGLNQLVEGADSKLSYIEITNAQHFEAFISTFWRVPPFTGPVQFVPLHYYLFQALDTMKDYLEGNRERLPPSQVVRPKPRELKAYEDTDAGTDLLPDIQENPHRADRITFRNRVLNIPK